MCHHTILRNDGQSIVSPHLSLSLGLVGSYVGISMYVQSASSRTPIALFGAGMMPIDP